MRKTILLALFLVSTVLIQGTESIVTSAAGIDIYMGLLKGGELSEDYHEDMLRRIERRDEVVLTQLAESVHDLWLLAMGHGLGGVKVSRTMQEYSRAALLKIAHACIAPLGDLLAREVASLGKLKINKTSRYREWLGQFLIGLQADPLNGYKAFEVTIAAVVSPITRAGEGSIKLHDCLQQDMQNMFLRFMYDNRVLQARWFSVYSSAIVGRTVNWALIADQSDGIVNLFLDRAKRLVSFFEGKFLCIESREKFFYLLFTLKFFLLARSLSGELLTNSELERLALETYYGSITGLDREKAFAHYELFGKEFSKISTSFDIAILERQLI